MANTSSARGAVALALSLIEGHHRFLNHNTGTTTDPQIDHFVLNPEGVLSNNRHFINKTAMEYQPNGDGTTEGQSLLILGYLYAFIATKNSKYLDAAEKYWRAYVRYFYAGQPIPDTPARWISNWIVNAKEPILANYPLNTTEPTEGGFKGVLVNFTNGLGQISAGSPNWGQYLDKATFAFVGQLGWSSIVASVYADNGSGGPDYDTPGLKYDVDWIVAWSGQKIDSNGTVLESGLGSGEFGKVKLKNTTLNGNYKLNYTTRQPVANGGYTIKRNEVQHNRPMHVPVNPSTVAFNRFRMSNAADGEEWFADACYLLWKITGNNKYKRALDASLFTLREFAGITATIPDPDYGIFFKNDPTQADPFHWNTSYDFTYPSGVDITYTRNASTGYVDFTITDVADLTWECVLDTPAPITANTYIQMYYGVTDPGERGINIRARFTYKATLASPDVYYYMDVPQFFADTGEVWNPLISDYKAELNNGYPWITGSTQRMTGYGGVVDLIVSRWENVGPGNETGRGANCVFPNDDAGLIIDFADQENGAIYLEEIIYRSNGEFDVRIEDDDGWRWYWILPDTVNEWESYLFSPENLVFSGYQPGRAGRPDPAQPALSTVAEVTIILENSSDTWKYFEWFRINYAPTTFSESSGFITEFRITFEAGVGPNVYGNIGDIKLYQIGAQPASPLPYTPGVIPFSNVYDVATGVLDSTNGLPYPGYQYPLIWSLNSSDNARLNNMVDFLHASQAAYHTFIGQLGPVASAYVWDIPSNTQYGTANAFTMYHWGSDVAWSGYQPRAFQAGARALQELTYQAQTVPTKLTTYLNNWVDWLDTYYTTHGIFPTDFPATVPAAPLSNDFTGHMTGLWLAGLCLCEMGGLANTKLRKLQEAAVKELHANYRIVAVDHKLNGAWSGNVTIANDNSQFFGFWAGEILRGLGLYALVKSKNPNRDMYLTYPMPPHDEYYDNVTLLLRSENAGGLPADASMVPKVPIRTQGYSLTASDPLYGTHCISLSGSNSGILYPASPDFYMPRKHTIEFWIKSSTRGGFVMSLGGGSMIAWSSFQFVWQEGQYINFAASSANAGYDIGSETGTEGRLGVVPANTWTHVQVCQDGDNWYGFIAGQLLWQRNYPGKDYFDPVTRGLLIGANYTNVWDTGTMTNCMAGFIQGVRLTKGKCRNKASFTPSQLIPPVR